MRPYFDDGQCVIYHGDCREILPRLKADAVLTDPPYGVDFRGETWDGPLCSIRENWLGIARRVAPIVAFTTAPTTLWDYPRPDWVLCWARPAAQSRTSTGEFNHWTPVLVYGKAKWNPDVLTLHAPTEGRLNLGIEHPCPKPEKLMRWLVEGASVLGGSVLDPFMGSGTTLRAAKDLGRKAIGIEIEERYCEIAAKRLAQQVLEFGA